MQTNVKSTALANKYRTAQAAAEKASAELLAAYDELSARYDALRSERGAIVALPIPREDLIERLQEWVDAQQAKVLNRLKAETRCMRKVTVTNPTGDGVIQTSEYTNDVPHFLKQHATDNPERMLPFLRLFNDFRSGSSVDDFDDHLLIGLLAVPIRDAIADTIHALPWYPEKVAPPREQREAMLAELDAKMDAVSADMDELKATARAAGITLPTRY